MQMVKVENEIWNYSDKELKLIFHYKCENLVDSPNVPPVLLYSQALVYKAFMRNANDKYDKSLRKCIRALENNYPGRNTIEWDNLIEI